MQALEYAPVRAPYAAIARDSRGRAIDEPKLTSRTEFQRDRDRIIHSAAFRRLAHKTQVFVPHEGDCFRTRLTHSLEVGQIARALARALGLDDDLAEALALAHDLGHTPFGHVGEDVLDALMFPFGGFDHNAQTLRIVTKLERRYASFDGLNLTYEALEGLVKHNGPLLEQDGTPVPRYAQRGLPATFVELDMQCDLGLRQFASAEAQVAALADDIAYIGHDIDDGLRAGLLDFSQIAEVDFLRDIGSELESLYPGLEPARVIHELVRCLLTHFIEDAIAESRRRILVAAVTSLDEVRAQPQPLVGFSEATTSAERIIKSFLFQHLYRHQRINRHREQAGEVISNLFPRYVADTELMPQDWAEAARRIGTDEARRARLVCDYIAGMTDRYAIFEHERLFGKAPDLGRGPTSTGAGHG
jgi:dGTPase